MVVLRKWDHDRRHGRDAGKPPAGSANIFQRAVALRVMALGALEWAVAP
jgi:hypothetical protein